MGRMTKCHFESFEQNKQSRVEKLYEPSCGPITTRSHQLSRKKGRASLPARSGPVRRKNFPPPCFRVDQEKGESCRHSPDPSREKQTATAYASHLKDGLPTFTGPIREKQTATHTLSRNSRRIPAENRQNRKQTNRQQHKNVNI